MSSSRTGPRTTQTSDSVSSEQAVLEFWFGPLDADGRASPERRARWWQKSEAFDSEIRERFGVLHSEIVAGEHTAWAERPSGAIALVIVLDQLSRNMFRGGPGMYATDEEARTIADRAIERGFDQELAAAERTFLYMPFMHCESLEAQERCIALFASMVEASDGVVAKGAAGSLDFARRHRDIVARFGRFPHRNAILGRESTPEELEFLQGPGSSF